MTFRVGQKVVCVDAGDPDPSCISHMSFCLPIGLVKGNIYTIVAVGLLHPYDITRQPCVRIAEESGRHAYWATRFRPIVERKTDISLFKRMLLPQGVEADA